MAKGKGKTNSSGSTAQLRSRKRDRSRDEIPQTDDVQAPLKQQDTKEDSSSVVASPQLPQCLLQVCAMITHQQDQAVEQPCLTKQDESKEEKLSEKTNMCLKDVTVKNVEGQQESTVTTASELEGCTVHSNNDTNKSGIEEDSPQDSIRPPSPTGSDQPQVISPTSEEGDGSCEATLEKQLDSKETSQSDLEKNHETSQEDACTLSMADVKENTKEAPLGLRTKKKRRMGMCGLTEKERSHFLLAQKRENEQGGGEELERQICTNAADPVAQERIISSIFVASSLLSIPVHSIAEQNPAETLKSSRCGVNNRAEAEVHVAVTTSDGTSPVCDPGSLEVKSCEAVRGTEPGPDQTGEPESCPITKHNVLQHLVNQEKQELEEVTTCVTTETPEKQSTDGEDKSTEAGGCAAMGSYINPAENEESEKKKATAGLQVQRETETSDEVEEEMMVDGSDGSDEEGISSTVTGPGGFNCGSVELSEAAVTPPGRKDSHDLKFELAPPTLTSGHTRTRDPTEVLASGCLDYVSDSQLNTIVLIEEEVKEREKTFGSSDNPGDATDLILGLIRELSSLNQKVMATHRELENLQRGSKASKSSLH